MTLELNGGSWTLLIEVKGTDTKEEKQNLLVSLYEARIAIRKKMVEVTSDLIDETYRPQRP